MANYVANPTGALFHADDTSPIKFIMSAVGCGKTVVCIQELMLRSVLQEPDAEGVRRTRWAIARSSFGQLKTTTIRTFQEWVPAKLCRIVYDSPIRGHIKMYPLPDGTFLDAEFLFMSLDSPDAIDNLLSLELTGAFINELAEIDNTGLVSDLQMRLARFPPKKDGVGATWSGLIADYNPPPRGGWLHKLTEVDRSPGYTLYKMPPPLLVERDPSNPDDVNKIKFVPNPDAENVQNHEKGYDYWLDIAKLNLHDWEFIRRFVLGEYPHGRGGRAIFPQYSDARHTIRSGTMLPRRSVKLLIGVDFGLCYDDQTEVLTREGFKYFRDVTLEDYMATRNPENGNLEYHKPNFLVDEQHDGDMITMENQSINMCVTPEHMIPITFRETPDKVHFKNAEWVEQRPGGHHYVDLMANWQGESPESIKGHRAEWFARFMGIWMSDGSIEKVGKSYRIQVAQTKPKSKDAIRELLGDSWYEDDVGFRKTDNELGAWLYSLGSVKKERAIPPEIMDLSTDLIKEFIAWFTLGDGHIRTRENGAVEHTVWTAHLHIVRQFHELALKAGWAASSAPTCASHSTFSDGRTVYGGEGWSITFKKRATRAELQATKISRHHYKGRRYCVNVEHHTLYVRRGGKTHWNGNTPAATFVQPIDGKVVVFDEITTRETSLTEMIEDILVPLLRTKYQGYQVLVVGDPTGGGRDQYAKMTPRKLFAQYGIKYIPAPTNDFPTLRDCTNKYLRGNNSFGVMDNCQEVIGAFLGGYQWKDSQGSEVNEKPQKEGEKGWSSHVMDSLMQVLIYLQKGGATYVDGAPIDHNSFADVRPPDPSSQGEQQDFLYA